MARGRYERVFVVLETVLETECFVFLLHDFNVGLFWQTFLPLAAHCLAMALMSVGFLRPWNLARPHDRAWAVTGMTMMLAAPLAGFLGFVAVYALVTSSPTSRSDVLRDFQDYITYDASVTATSRPKGEQFIMDEVDVAPLRQILQGKDINLKRGAILSLSRLPRHDAVSLLKSALSDPEREIRYYASTALSDMEREFNDRIFRLVKETEANPTLVERHIELARLALAYVESGLLDEAVEHYFLELGSRSLDKALIVAKEDRRIFLLLGRLKHQAGDLAGAAEWLHRYLEGRDAFPPYEAKDGRDAALLLAEAEFGLGNVSTAIDVLSRAMKLFPADDGVAQAALVIMGHKGAQGA